MTSATHLARAQEALFIGRRARIVQHARLAPACDEDAAQMRFAVEDALNTADFGDCGRLIVVRRLRLQAVPPRAEPALMARALEAAWREASAYAVPAAHRQASQANAVFFASRFAARLAWLERVAMHAEASAWYWPAALPELKRASAVDAAPSAIETVIEALWHESPVQALQALRAWPDNAVAALARRMPLAVNRRLVEAFAPASLHEQNVAMTAPVRRSAAALRVPAAWHPVIERLARQMPLPEPGAAWIAALWLAPLMSPAPRVEQALAVAQAAQRWMERGSHAEAFIEPQAGTAPSVPVRPVVPALHRPVPASGVAAVPSSAAEVPTPSASPHPTAAPPALRIDSGLRPEARAERTPVHAARRSPWALPWLEDGAPTEHGGLMILINLLQALRLKRWLEQQPANAQPLFVNALFAQTLSWCGAPSDDPQHAWFAPDDETKPTDPFGLSLPFLRQAQDDRGYRLRMDREAARTNPFALSLSKGLFGIEQGFDKLSPNGDGVPAGAALRLWHLRMRRALRRHVGLDLPALVQRPAWVSATATHIDVVFPLDEVDLRLRRLGLDSDPGWVPWFGRIVAFHFVTREQWPLAAQEAPHG